VIENQPIELSTEGDFWALVQEPSTRVKDEVSLVELADQAVDKFPDRPLVRAAAVIVLSYRAIGDKAAIPHRRTELIAQCQEAIDALDWRSGFQACRWHLSAKLALAALLIGEGRLDDAWSALDVAPELSDEAFRHGQLTTNVVKCALIRTAVSSLLPDVSLPALERTVASILSGARLLPVNYRFSNQYAFEEVAYVYSMLRQLYNWSMSRKEIAGLNQLLAEGVDWRVVGAPFKYILPERQ
jgi:hypothetical protein